jgi:septum formation protein
MSVEDKNRIKFILASASPRRRDVFSLLKLDFDVFVPKSDQEQLYADPFLTVKKNSIKKAKAVLNYVRIYEDYTDTVICGFDTVVYFKDKYYLKPKTIKEASSFLRELSGSTHEVLSGICMLSLKSGRQVTGCEKTEVSFRKLDESHIERYLEMEDVLDKAAGYNIAGAGAFLVKRIKGCFYNVTGMPVYRFIRLLEELEYKF